ncbi:hypothetical protein OLL83_002333 [Shewanella algae]|uniref:hypothetical protein n=1 Tax=Shewanella algae TaxID=38313 RepID=UPI001687DAFB|nr:hypothetical protein [Shewanella algae]QNV05647.1 hypothetical protein EIY89_11210 [Shewanella algae]UZD56659.1 hypothetical protein OLL83_002333 [Shewanella algae]
MTAQLWDKVANQFNFNLEIDVQRFCHLVKPDARILDFGCGAELRSFNLHTICNGAKSRHIGA